MSKQKSNNQKPRAKSGNKSATSKKSKGAKEKKAKSGKDSPKKPKGTWHHHHHNHNNNHHHHNKNDKKAKPRGPPITSKSNANRTTKVASTREKGMTKHKFVLKGRVPPLAADGILSPSRLQADEMTTIYAVPSGHFKTADDVVRFNDFEILEQIGKGGFAVVFKARNLKTGQMVACKTVKIGMFF